MDNKYSEKELLELEDEMDYILCRYQVKQASFDDTKQLLSHLQRSYDLLEDTGSEGQVWHKPSLLRQCWNQLHTYSWTLWLISVAVFGMLTLIYDPVESAMLIRKQSFSLFMPLFIIIGVLYSYQSWNKEMRLVEMITPFPPALLLYSRLLVILSINVGLGMVSSVYLTITVHDLSFVHFVLSWLAPVLFLLGILAYVTFWKGMIVGFIVTFVLLWLEMIGVPILIRHINRIEALILPVQSGMVIGGIVLLWLAYRKGLTWKTNAIK